MRQWFRLRFQRKLLSKASSTCKSKYTNGARYAIRALHKNVIVAVIATGTHAGKEMYFPRIPFMPVVTTFPFEMKHKQFPVCSAFGVTCNKSQGQAFHTIGTYVFTPTSVFTWAAVCCTQLSWVTTPCESTTK